MSITCKKAGMRITDDLGGDTLVMCHPPTSLISFSFFYFEKQNTITAVRVPPNAILLPGSKSMQKCLLLAEGNVFAEWRIRLKLRLNF
jgi:hypothetical protein